MRRRQRHNQEASTRAVANRISELWRVFNADRRRALDSSEFAAARALECATTRRVVLSKPGKFPAWHDENLASPEQCAEITALDAAAWSRCRLTDDARERIVREIKRLERLFVVSSGIRYVLTRPLALADLLEAVSNVLESILAAFRAVPDIRASLALRPSPPPPLETRPAQQICAPNLA